MFRFLLEGADEQVFDSPVHWSHDDDVLGQQGDRCLRSTLGDSHGAVATGHGHCNDEELDSGAQTWASFDP